MENTHAKAGVSGTTAMGTSPRPRACRFIVAKTSWFRYPMAKLGLQPMDANGVCVYINMYVNPKIGGDENHPKWMVKIINGSKPL